MDGTPTAAGRVRKPLRAAQSITLIPQGKPKPQAIWTHDGCALDTSRVSVRNGERDSILFIREAQRADSGRYQLRVQLGGLEATATIDILVIGTAGGGGEWEMGGPQELPLQAEEEPAQRAEEAGARPPRHVWDTGWAQEG